MATLNLGQLGTEEELKRYIVEHPNAFTQFKGLIKQDGNLSANQAGKSAYNKVLQIWKSQKNQPDTSASQQSSYLQSRVGGNVPFESDISIGSNPFNSDLSGMSGFNSSLSQNSSSSVASSLNLPLEVSKTIKLLSAADRVPKPKNVPASIQTALTNIKPVDMGFGAYTFPSINTIAVPNQVKSINPSQSMSIIDPAYFGFQKDSQMPAARAQTALRLQKQLAKYKYVEPMYNIKTNKQGKLKDDPNWVWSEVYQEYIPVNRYLLSKNRKIETIQQKFNSNIYKSAAIIGSSLSQTQAIQYIPNLVRSVVAANNDFSKVGIGPISSKSLPFYAGRWIDVVSGRVRILPPASAKYLNPTSYQAKLSYLQARLLNNWNKYVSSQEQYLKFQNVNASSYQNNAKNQITDGLKESNKNYLNSFLWMQGEIQSQKYNMPLPPSSMIVISTMKQFSSAGFQNMVNIINTSITNYNKSGTDITMADVKKVNDILYQGGIQAISKVRQSNKAIGAKKVNRIVSAYTVWMDKGSGKMSRTLKKLAKTLIPPQIKAQDLETVNKIVDEAQNTLNSKNFIPTPDQINSLKTWFSLDTNKRPSTQNMKSFINLSKSLQSEASLREKKVKGEILPSLQYDYSRFGQQNQLKPQKLAII